MKKSVVLGLTLFLTICICLSLCDVKKVTAFCESTYALEIFVSTDGDDANSGSANFPIKTLEGAKQKIAEYRETHSIEDNICVWFYGGRYELTEAFELSGETFNNVTFSAIEGENVQITGSKPISGFSEESVNGVRTFTKTLNPDVDPMGFKSLFNGYKQLTVPRYPEEDFLYVKKTDPENDLWTADNSPWDFTLGQRSFYADVNDLKTDFTNVQDVQIRILHYWHDELMFLTEYNRESGKIGLSRPSTMTIRDIDRYYFENVFEALNEEGEWYLNNVTNKLYYVPFPSETAETTVLYAATANSLLKIEQTKNVKFSGITFCETDWEIPVADEEPNSWYAINNVDTSQAAYYVKGVVTVEYSNKVNFENCEFINLGGSGIKFKNGSQNCSVTNCYFKHLAATGVFAGGANIKTDDVRCVGNITIKNNIITEYGTKFYGAIGIQITYCDGAEIMNNEISNGYYTAISCGWVWGYGYHLTNNIIIKNNLIYDIGQGWLSDMGGIYMLGIQEGTEISGNVIHNVAADAGEGGYGGWGIYLDEGSSRMLIEYNLVYCCGSQNFNVHYGEGNTVRNNIFAFGTEGQANVGSRKEDHATVFMYDNIFLGVDAEPMIVDMMDTSHFYENGNLYWDITNGTDLYFAKDYDKNMIKYSAAVKQGFLNNSLVSDPKFTDALNFDFTLSEDSPAFELNFKAWDYSLAGTLSGSVIGTDKAGGLTKYNYNANRVYSTNKLSFDAVTPLMIILIVIAALMLIAFLVNIIIKSQSTEYIQFILLLAIGALSVCIYKVFILWNPTAYVLASIACILLTGFYAIITDFKKGYSIKRLLIGYLIKTAIIAALFYGLVTPLNLLAHVGEALSVIIGLGAITMVLLAYTVIWFKEQIKITSRH